MESLIRPLVLVGGLVGMVALYYLNLYVAERYWLPVVDDEDDRDPAE